MDKEVDCLMESQKTFRTDLDVLEDRVMDVEMSTKGAHTMMAPLKDDVQELNDTVANLSNQLESVRVEDIAWCRSRISKLEKPNNPANKSLWLLVNQLSRQVEDQARSDRCSSSWDGWDEGKGWGLGDVVVDDPFEGLDH
jgi:predicted nuclease with TOPRIM domain